MKLKELGHPNLSQSQFEYTLECSVSPTIADQEVGNIGDR